MSKFKTDQENFWAGEFGTEYISRNESKHWLAANIHLFSKILSKTNKINSVIEFGPNIGLNLSAIKSLKPNIETAGVEINKDAFKILQKEFPNGEFLNESISDFEPTKEYDLSFIKGVLIHLNPNLLEETYEKIYKSTSKYVLICEYYNPSPVSIDYRGHKDKLFKRDFAGEFMDKFNDVVLLDYGFIYRNDQYFPQDDINWFLMKKNN